MGHKQGGRVGAEIIPYMTLDVVPLEYGYSLLVSYYVMSQCIIFS
jgi:hypothetical protein